MISQGWEIRNTLSLHSENCDVEVFLLNVLLLSNFHLNKLAKKKKDIIYVSKISSGVITNIVLGLSTSVRIKTGLI